MTDLNSPNLGNTSDPDISARVQAAIDRCLDREIGTLIERAVERRLEEQVRPHIDQSTAGMLQASITRRLASKQASRYEHIFENKMIFGGRWILAPVYAILVMVLIVLGVKVIAEFVQLLQMAWKIPFTKSAEVIIQALNVVDGVLVMNLILMIIFVGYTNFVSQIHAARAEDWPEWTKRLDYPGLKLQLLGSMIAISSLVLLQQLIEMFEREHAPVDPLKIGLTIAVQMTFVGSAIIVAMVNRIESSSEQPGSSSR